MYVLGFSLNWLNLYQKIQWSQSYGGLDTDLHSGTLLHLVGLCDNLEGLSQRAL